MPATVPFMLCAWMSASKSAEVDRMLSPNLIRAPRRGAPLPSTEPAHGAGTGAAVVLAARFASSGALACFRMEDCFRRARKRPC
jgi:hypothetical protein